MTSNQVLHCVYDGVVVCSVWHCRLLVLPLANQLALQHWKLSHYIFRQGAERYTFSCTRSAVGYGHGHGHRHELPTILRRAPLQTICYTSGCVLYICYMTPPASVNRCMGDEERRWCTDTDGTFACHPTRSFYRRVLFM